MMQNRQSIFNIKNVLVSEIATALDVSSMSLAVKISEVNADDNYSVTGSFRVVTLWTNAPTKRGKFTAVLDDRLNIISLKITDERSKQE